MVIRQPIVKQHEQQKQIIYIIGDNYADKSELLEFFVGQEYNIQNQYNEQNSLRIYYSRIPDQNRILEIYDFNHDRFAREYLDIYIEMLPKPDVILYCVSLESTKTELQEWVQLIQHEDSSILFISSDINTYRERSQLISKLSPFFKKDIVDSIYFTQFDKNSLSVCLSNLSKGMSLKNLVRRVNSWSSVKSFLRRVSSFIKNKPQSIV